MMVPSVKFDLSERAADDDEELVGGNGSHLAVEDLGKRRAWGLWDRCCVIDNRTDSRGDRLIAGGHRGRNADRQDCGQAERQDGGAEADSACHTTNLRHAA